jgi:glycosyltransferase involved in cell wall biosynthesis
MKILYATMQYGHGYFQGTERYVTTLVQGMQQRGHACVIYAGDPEQRGQATRLGEVVSQEPVVRFIPTRGLLGVEGVPADDWKAVLDQEQPDCVHVANAAHIGLGLIFAAVQVGIPVIVTIMDYWWLCPKHLLTHYRGTTCDARVHWTECLRCMGLSDKRAWVRGTASMPLSGASTLPVLFFGRALQRGLGLAELKRWRHRQAHTLRALNSASAVIFPSSAARNFIASRLEHTRTHDVPYGIDEHWFAQGANERVKPQSPESATLGFAGALEPHKGTHLILEAAHQLGWTRTRIRIAGDGSNPDYQQRLRKLAAGLNVEFVGRLPSEAMPDFLRSLDLFLLTSSWPENLPIAMLEAQAAGIPVMSSKVAGAAEAIGDPAMLFEIGDAASLAEQLRQWISSAEADTTQRKNKVSTIGEMVAKTLDVYQQL